MLAPAASSVRPTAFRLLLRAEHFIAPRDPPPAACGCYTREDCGAGGTCHYVPCMPNGKNDGVCTNTAAS